MSELAELGKQTSPQPDCHNAWFDSLTLNPFETGRGPGRLINPFEDVSKELSMLEGKTEIAPLEFEDYGLKREFYKDDSGSGYATEYPHGLTVVRYEAGNFMLRLPAGVRYSENDDGLGTVFDTRGKKIATFEADGTLHVRSPEGTFTETANGDVSFEPKPVKGHKSAGSKKETHSTHPLLPEVTISSDTKSSEQKTTKKGAVDQNKKPEQKLKPKSTSFDPLEGLDLDKLGY